MTATADRLEWMDAAVCLEVGPDLFFEDVQGGADPVAAKALCWSCEARPDCLSWALEHGTRDGLFGGFTDRPRRVIARRVRAGESLEDIIAADDAAFYARTEAAAAAQLEADRRRRERNREQTRLAKAGVS